MWIIESHGTDTISVYESSFIASRSSMIIKQEQDQTQIHCHLCNGVYCVSVLTAGEKTSTLPVDRSMVQRCRQGGKQVRGWTEMVLYYMMMASCCLFDKNLHIKTADKECWRLLHRTSEQHPLDGFTKQQRVHGSGQKGLPNYHTDQIFYRGLGGEKNRPVASREVYNSSISQRAVAHSNATIIFRTLF